MQFDGLVVGATHTEKVPTLEEAFGVPKTRKVYWPTAPGIVTVAEVAGGANVAAALPVAI